jgi:hypothetical protein
MRKVCHMKQRDARVTCGSAVGAKHDVLIDVRERPMAPRMAAQKSAFR